MNSIAYERLEVYGFGFDYPTNCQVEFNPKSKRDEAQVYAVVERMAGSFTCH